MWLDYYILQMSPPETRTLGKKKIGSSPENFDINLFLDKMYMCRKETTKKIRQLLSGWAKFYALYTFSEKLLLREKPELFEKHLKDDLI